jgi:pimeloyl-ACP methyl ester carboxylesterase
MFCYKFTNMKSKIEKELYFPISEITLTGNLSIPENAKGLIVFAHGSGSSRHSTRNKKVAARLQDAGFGTLLFDLLTVKEDEDYSNRFNIDLLTDRLIKVTDFLKSNPDTADLAIGYFGASTGAAATLMAAAKLGSTITAIVSRGGRADMAELFLPQVTSPTLLIVGGLDSEVIALNEKAYTTLRNATKELRIVSGATHLFEEPGKLQEVANLAIEWFNKYVVTVEQ